MYKLPFCQLERNIKTLPSLNIYQCGLEREREREISSAILNRVRERHRRSYHMGGREGEANLTHTQREREREREFGFTQRAQLLTERNRVTDRQIHI
jgi:hypothetical protein